MVNCCVCSYSCGRLAVVSAAGFSSQSYLNIVKQYYFLVFFLIRFLNSSELARSVCRYMLHVCLFFVVLKCNIFVGFCLHNDILLFCAHFMDFSVHFGKSVVFFFLF